MYEEEEVKAEGDGVEGDVDARIVDDDESGRGGNAEEDNGDVPRWDIDGTG